MESPVITPNLRSDTNESPSLLSRFNLPPPLQAFYKESLQIQRELGCFKDFDFSLEKFQELKSAETDLFGATECEVSRLLGHGSRTKSAIIVFNGIGEKTGSLSPLLEGLHTLGFNVLAPALPRHYSLDALGKLTPKDFVRRTQDAISIGSGLGDKVILCGASTGGLMAMMGSALMEGWGVECEVMPVAPATKFRDTPEILVDTLITIASHSKDSDKLPITGRRAAGGSLKGLSAVARFRCDVEATLSRSDLSHVSKVSVYADSEDGALAPDAGDVALSWFRGQIPGEVLPFEFPLHQRVDDFDSFDWTPSFNRVFEQVLDVFAKRRGELL